MFQVLAPNGKLIPPDQVFGEGGLFDKDVEEKTRLAFKVTMKKLEKYNTVSEFNKEHLKTAKVDQIVECFPNTLLKLLPNTIAKTKWNKKSKEVENWDIWWDIIVSFILILITSIVSCGSISTILCILCIGIKLYIISIIIVIYVFTIITIIIIIIKIIIIIIIMSWYIRWGMHEKILSPLRAQAETIHKW